MGGFEQCDGIHMWVVCRAVETEEERKQMATKALLNLTKQENNESAMSVTVSVRGHDMTPEEIEGVHDLARDMYQHAVCTDGVVTAERGEINEHLHCQCMFLGRWKRGNAFPMGEKLKSIMEERQIFARGFVCKVVMHDLDENRSWLSLSGYE
jgi:hypothetical protein